MKYKNLPGRKDVKNNVNSILVKNKDRKSKGNLFSSFREVSIKSNNIGSKESAKE
jgi:hypothetical protein